MSLKALGTVTVLNVNDGQNGAPGQRGASVAASIPQYYLSTSPSSLAGGQWVDTPPEVTTGTYLWERVKTTLSDSQVIYSDAVYSATISGVKHDVDQINNSITNKVWQSDIKNSINSYDGSTVSNLRNRVTQTETDISGITSRVSDVESTTDSLGTRMSSAESSITQNANNIALKVSADGVISSINQSPEQITISADKVNIAGAAIFDSYSLKSQTVSDFSVMYAKSTDPDTFTPVSGSEGQWSVNAPEWEAGKYIWQRTAKTINGNTTYSYTCIQGASGQSSYTYVRYSANANGSGMVTSPSSATKYIGIYTGDSSTVPAYTAFTWSKYIGEDGDTSYTYVRYSANSDGSSMTSSPQSNSKYIGIYTGTSSTAPSTASSYTWSQYRGNDGTSVSITSIKYAISDTENQPNDSSFTYTSVPTVAEGKWLWTLTEYSSGTKLYTKSKQGVSGNSVSILSITYAVTDTDSTPQSFPYSSAPSVSEGQWLWTKVTFSDNNSVITKAKQGKSGTSYYTHIRYSVNSNGNPMVSTPTDETMYIGIYSGTSSTAPTSYGSYTWSRYVGKDGTNKVTVYLYQRAASAPSKPSSTLTYTFSTGALSGTLGSWQQTIPSNTNDTNPVWMTIATASAIATATTDTISSSEWSAPVEYMKDGYNQATINLYQRADSTPSKPSSAVTYTFSTGALSSIPSGWSRTIPANTSGNPCYVTSVSVMSRGATYSITGSSWSDPVKMVEDGVSVTSVTTTPSTVDDGYSTITITLSDGSSETFQVKNGSKGTSGESSQWYFGTALTHTSGTASTATGISSAVLGDMYLNNNTYSVYRCTTKGASGTAQWTYAGNLLEGLIEDIGASRKNIIIGGHITRNIWVNGSGAEQSSTKCMTTEYIPVGASTKYTLQFWQPTNSQTGNNRLWTGRFLWFTSAKVYISGYTSTYFADTHVSYTATSPSNAAYVRITYQFPTGATITPYTWTPFDKDYRWKLEEGDTASDWSYAPEDELASSQQIYYRSNGSTAPNPPTSLVVRSDVVNVDWTTRRLPMIDPNNTSYKYCFTCSQMVSVNGDFLGTTAVVPDEAHTVIDGGNIITQSITSSQLATDAIQSLNYYSGSSENPKAAPSGSHYSATGTFLDLQYGDFYTPNFGVDSQFGHAYINGEIIATSGRIGSNTNTSWTIGTYTDFDTNQHGSIIGNGDAFIQSGKWMISGDRIDTRWYNNNLQLTYIYDSSSNTYYDYGMNVPNLSSTGSSPKDQQSFLYIRKATGSIPTQDSSWTYLFRVAKDGTIFVNETAIAGANGDFLSKSATSSQTVAGPVTFTQQISGSITKASSLSTSGTIRTNLESTSTVTYTSGGNITPGVTGTLPVGNGGTGQTSAVNAANAFMNALSTGSSTPVDADYYISQYVNGGTTTTTYHRRPMSALWSYIKNKLSSDHSILDNLYVSTSGGVVNGNLAINGSLISDEIIAGSLIVNGDARFVNTINGDISGNAATATSATNATTAEKLGTNAGSGTQPIYFSNGIPVATTYSLNKTVPSDAKFTDTTYTPASSVTAVGTSAVVGSSTNYARQDHVHNIALATGDSNGQIKIAGSNVSVKGLAALAYKASLGASDVGLGNVTNNAQVKKISSSINNNLVTWGGTDGATVADSGIAKGSVTTKITLSGTDYSASSNTITITKANLQSAIQDTSYVLMTAEERSKLSSIAVSSGGTIDFSGVTASAPLTATVNQTTKAVNLTHNTSGATAGTYKSVTINTYGHVTGGTNPTTLSGYGITDAKIASGVITLGSNTITPLTADSTIAAGKVSGAVAEATKATKDGSGNTITSTYLKKTTDDTMTGILTLYREGTTANNYPAGVKFSVKDTTTSQTYSSAYIYAYQDHQATTYGTNMVIHSGGGMFIGSGESPASHYSAKGASYSGEDTFITADGTMYVQANGNTIANRIGFYINTSHQIIPCKADAATNNIGSIGTSSYKWNAMYATTFYGALSGNASTATTAGNVTGTVSIANGGTGQTTAVNAANAFLSALPTWTADPTDSTYFIRQDTAGTNSFGRLPFSTMWNYIKGKVTTINDVFVKLSGDQTVAGAKTFSDAVITNSTLTNKSELIIYKATTASNAYNASNPRITFSNGSYGTSSEQSIQLIFTDYDSVVAPASLTLVGNQSNANGGEKFIAPNVRVTNQFQYGTAAYTVYNSTTKSIDFIFN